MDALLTAFMTFLSTVKNVSFLKPTSGILGYPVLGIRKGTYQMKKLALVLTLLMFPAMAMADEPTPTDTAGESEPPNDGSLPAPASDNDAQPEVATPGLPQGGVVEQAGVGGNVGYGRAGVLELGGSAGLFAGSGLKSVQVAPQVGWFIADNLQLSGIASLNYTRADGADGVSVGVLAEPSYHLPFNRTTFAFLGLGMGVAYVEGPGVGFAMAPRVGMNILLGRSGILTPSLSYQYTTHSLDDAGEDRTLIGVSQAVRASIGYTIML